MLQIITTIIDTHDAPHANAEKFRTVLGYLGLDVRSVDVQLGETPDQASNLRARMRQAEQREQHDRSGAEYEASFQGARKR